MPPGYPEQTAPVGAGDNRDFKQRLIDTGEGKEPTGRLMAFPDAHNSPNDIKKIPFGPVGTSQGIVGAKSAGATEAHEGIFFQHTISD